MTQRFKSSQQTCEIYGIFDRVYSKIKHRAFTEKLNRQLNKPCSENMSFLVVSISEGLDKSTEKNILTRKVNNKIILKRKLLGTR